MTNRKLAYIVKDQEPLVLAAHETVLHACRCMRERHAGSVLVIDDQQRLSGIFTGRDAVPGARYARLRLSPLTPSFVGARYHHCGC